jgi:hypothetical protein
MMMMTLLILYSRKFNFSFILHISNGNRKLITNFFKKVFLLVPCYFTLTEVSPAHAIRVWMGEKIVDLLIRHYGTRQ